MDSAQSLVAKNIIKEFKQGDKSLEVLKGICQTFERGQSYAIVGVSGSGKSTFMHILGGLDQPTSGEVSLFGTRLHKNGQLSKVLNTHLGFVFQFHYLIKELTVLQNVMLPGLIAGVAAGEALARAQELLAYLGMTEKVDVYPVSLSGGEQQRVSIIRAMFNRPAFLIADEPTGNLDEGNAAQALTLLLDGCKTWNMGLILCSHDRQVYDKMGTVLRMHHGVLVTEK